MIIQIYVTVADLIAKKTVLINLHECTSIPMMLQRRKVLIFSKFLQKLK